MPRKRKKIDPMPFLRRCEWKNCEEEAPHNAPKRRRMEDDAPFKPDDFYWFCPAHIKEYNKQWDFFAGMSDEEIMEFQKEAVTGHRKTSKWDLRADLNSIWDWYSKTNFINPDFVHETYRRESSKRPALPKHIQNAADVMGIELPKSLAELKKRYKTLVKQHHPDVNKGCKAAEEKFKSINQAYHTLLDCDFITA